MSAVVVDLASRRPARPAADPTAPSLDDVVRSLRLACSAELARHVGLLEARLAAIEARLAPSDPVPQAGTLSQIG
ncbi:hypothetical protein [Methylobacterium sp. WL12]|uniref:hypothetical protein n=1 Tax=Methylobacterium sp. WL12 TaxID=2603890 RepID=UPI001650BC19|nr:hypothetical protein [Methylobacterium sp. WL12]